VLDIGAGSGRDAAWFASQGLEVVAAEPSTAMRTRARSLHSSPLIQWIDDSLPGLTRTYRLGLAFDLILVSAVWMHVPPTDRGRAFRKVIGLLKPGGLLALTLRIGPAEPERAMYPVSLSEIEQLARSNGAFVETVSEQSDELGRSEIRWINVAVRLPDDGTGALPLLRHIILNDSKSSTYKLALLRAVCRIADGSAGYARDLSDDHVAVPLGLVGLYWIRLYLPLLTRDLPQSPTNRGMESLGFANDGFKALPSFVSHLDLRIGMRFDGERAAALDNALRGACDTIVRMPAHYMTYPDGQPVLPARRRARRSSPSVVQIDEAYLTSFGELLIPRRLWQAMQRFDAWIEPALVSEWTRLIKDYARSQARILDDVSVALAMQWSDPMRDVRVAREQAERLLSTTRLHCTWSGRLLAQDTLDVDHCFPWAIWPCGDLWNLLPAHRTVNQRQKRDKLPGAALLQASRERIWEWWQSAYLDCEGTLLPKQFETEAIATLPIAVREKPGLDDVFDGLSLQQVRLRNDQQAPLWDG
jgi:SAM-dependent methyltransferase